MLNSRTVIGIDPGVKGYKGYICGITGSVRVEKLGNPLTLKLPINDDLVIFAEKVQPRPSQSLRGVVTSCVNYGVLKAVLYLTGIEHHWVTPQEWQKELGLNRRWKRPKGMTDEQYSSWKYRERKKLHKKEAKRLFPALKVTLENADALLIAEYGRRVSEEV